MSRAAWAGMVVGLVGVGAIGTVAGAGPTSEPVRGPFVPFAAGADLEVSGRAQLVRTGVGTTIVTVELEGLEPGVTYPAHVHAAPCGVGEADGHYKLDPAGAASPPNEIWPGPLTANAAGRASGQVVADFTAGPTAVSVVVHRPGAAPNKIACADLG